MRILWVKMGGLWPSTTGGRVRSLQTISELARRHQVTVVTTHGAGDDPEGLARQLSQLPPRRLDCPTCVPKRGSAAFPAAVRARGCRHIPSTCGSGGCREVRAQVQTLMDGGRRSRASPISCSRR